MTDPAPLCIVAGAGPGMGLAIARRFALDGHNVAMVARDQAALDRHAVDIRGLGVRAEGFSADLGDEEQIGAVIGSIRRRFGEADVLVYNAAAWRPGPAMSIDPASFAADMALCVTGALVFAQAVYPAMKAARRGSMLFTGGGLALYPEMGKNAAALTAGKSALRGLVYALAGEVAADGIHVSLITIAGTVAAATAFDPVLIAEHYVAVHREPPAAWTIEHVFKG